MTTVRLLTLARDLQRRKARERTSNFVAEGVRTVEELLRSNLAIDGALVSASLDLTPRGSALREALAERGAETAEVSESDFATAAQTESPQGVLAIGVIPEWAWADVALEPPVRLLVLDAVQDPGNAGTMLRTAAALGVTATVALSGTVDLWNAKVVRSAVGTHFSHPALMTTWAEFDDWRGAHGVALWGADARGEALPSTAPGSSDRLALVVGNEGAGLSADAVARADRLVAVPVRGVESLNVAVAAGILLYELRR